MAPNLVKTSSQLSLDLSSHVSFSLEPPVSAYPPLTNPLTNDEILTYDEESGDNGNGSNDHPMHSIFARSSSSSPLKKQQRSDSSSFIFHLLVKDEAQRAVSCDQIEANLIADANVREEDQHCYVNNDNVQEEESYWDMPSDCDNAQQQQEDDDGDEQSEVLSTAQVERNLVQDALRRIQEEASLNKNTVVNSHPNHAYWDWPSEPILESEKKAVLIATVLLEESIREKLSIDSIIETEVRSNNKKEISGAMIESDNASTVDYWYWDSSNSSGSSNEETKDEIVAPHVHDPTHPNHSYWDFPNKPINEDEIKQKVIDQILQEERIRHLLSCGAVQEQEVNFHRSRRDDGKKSYHSATKAELNSMPENYWDFNASTIGSDNDLLSLLSKEKRALIDRILKEEELRYIVSTANIEHHLKKQHQQQQQQVSSGFDGSAVVSTSYWDW